VQALKKRCILYSKLIATKLACLFQNMTRFLGALMLNFYQEYLQFEIGLIVFYGVGISTTNVSQK